MFYTIYVLTAKLIELSVSLCLFPLGSDVTFPFFSALSLVKLYSLRTGAPLLLLL